MAYEPSFGTLTAEPPAGAEAENPKFRLAILGDFTARAARGLLEPSDDWAGRRGWKLNYENFEEFFERQEIALRLPWAGGATCVELKLPSFDELHPDRLVRQLDIFDDLVDLQKQLREDEPSEELVKRVLGYAKGAADPPALSDAPRGMVLPSVESLTELAELAARPTADENAKELGNKSLIGKLLGPWIKTLAKQKPTAEQLAGAVDQATQAALRQILHQEDLALLESAWRALAWLLKRVHKGGHVQVVVLDLSAEELAADLAGHDALEETALFRWLRDQGPEGPDAAPWTAVLGLYQFDLLGPHIDVLGRAAQIAEHFQAPFLSGATPALVEPGYKLDDDGAEAWQQLRDLPAARRLGLATPGFLVRGAYGATGTSIESLPFEEFDPQAPRQSLPWGHPALALGLLLAQSYLKQGWAFKPGVISELDEMPLFVRRDADGDEETIATAVRFSTSISQAVGKLGLMAWLPVRGRDAIGLSVFQSVAAEEPALLGCWAREGAAPPPKSTGQLPTNLSVQMSAKRTQPPPAADDESSDEESSDAFGESSDDFSSDFGDSGDSSSDDDDPLAGLGLDDDADSASSGEDSDELDLDSLLGDSSDEESSGEDSSSDDSGDDELAAMLAEMESDDSESDESSDAEDATDADESSSGDDDLDSMMAELGLDDDAETATEEPADDEALDPELAALLADSEDTDEPEGADEEATEADDDLDALLQGLDEDEPEPEEDARGEEASDEEPPDDRAAEDEAEEEPSVSDDELVELSAEDLVDESAMGGELSAEAAALLAEVQSQDPDSLLIDLVALCQPIAGESPAGAAIPFDLKEYLTEARKEVRVETFDADDPTRPSETKRADWPQIVRRCEEALTKTSKDLLLAARLTEALIKLHGFAGLRDGMRLMRLLVATAWDRLYPPLEEDDDLEVRAAPFNWLDDPVRGALFPTTVRTTPLLADERREYSYLDWRSALDSGDTSASQGFERAVMAADRDRCEQVVADLDQALSDFRALAADLDARMGEVAPGFSALRPALEECFNLAQQILSRKGPKPEAQAAASQSGPAAGGSAVATASGRSSMSTRDDAYRQLIEAANLLQRLEPHSPIPYLVQRAVELGKLPFPLLIRRLIREQSVLEELSRELGIPGEERAGDDD